MDNTFTLLVWGRDYNPSNWFYNPAYVVNRLYFIVGGSAVYKEQKKLLPGKLYLFNAEPFFRVRQSKEDPVDHIFFDFLTYRPLLTSEYLEVDPDTNRKLSGLITALTEELSAADGSDYVKLRTEDPARWAELGRHYLALLLHALQPESEEFPSYSEVTISVLKILHSKDLGDLSVQRIAEEMNMDVNYIIRRFKKEVGVTPHKYLAGMKKDQAIAYRRQGMSCAEIAERLGFGSQAAFSYFFKQETGTNLSSIN